MDKEMEYYGRFGSLDCSAPHDNPSIEGELNEAPSAGEDEESLGKAEPSDDEEAASAAKS
jgi:hypothetical protein